MKRKKKPRLRYVVWTGNERTIGRFRALKAAQKFARSWSIAKGTNTYVDDAIAKEPISTYQSGTSVSVW